MVMWDELLLAFALVMVIEGILPALNPHLFRRTMASVAGMNDRFLRAWGLILMTLGAVLLYVLRA